MTKDALVQLINDGAAVTVIPQLTFRYGALRQDAVSHACQAVHEASGDLLDEARAASSVDDCLRISTYVGGLLERLGAVSSLALMRADELCKEKD